MPDTAGFSTVGIAAQLLWMFPTCTHQASRHWHGVSWVVHQRTRHLSHYPKIWAWEEHNRHDAPPELESGHCPLFGDARTGQCPVRLDTGSEGRLWA